ncbi:40S ribosomal protein S29 [Acorus calamus]|uniref:40S ribosomal protein S29 n=1 Tax=Acorus calamus TaxID=4465 RepID=A0AAV9FTT3_ACOCL|nr:40S ribosomal protein S29 [Acorus calamus]
MSRNSHGLVKKNGPMCCRQCFRSNVKKIGFMKPFAPSAPSSLKPPLPPPRKEKQSAPINSSSVLDPADFPPLQPSKIASQRKPKEQVPLPPPPVSENALCWDQLFPGSTPSSQKLFSLPYFSPSLKNEEMVVDIEDKDCELATEHWANSLVGYIIGTKPVYTPFLQFLHRLWKPKGDFKLLLKGNGFFLVKFFLKEDMQSVLEGGPWTMNNRPFILRQWSPEVKMEQPRLTSIPVWVRLPTLPLHFWTPTAMGKIVSAIGTPLCMDTATRMFTRISYARVYVEIEAGETLPDSICVRHNGEL